jgi:hypothetical protein
VETASKEQGRGDDVQGGGALNRLLRWSNPEDEKVKTSTVYGVHQEWCSIGASSCIRATSRTKVMCK